MELSSDWKTSVAGEAATAGTVGYFAEYERDNTARYHDGFRVASSRSIDDETVVDSVYHALETDSTTNQHTEVDG